MTLAPLDHAAVARRLGTEVAALGRPPYTEAGPGVTRYAFTPAYRRTVERVRASLARLGLRTGLDPVGTLVARPPGERFFGVGSHLDSVRHGGRWDGVLGTLVGAEVRRAERDWGAAPRVGVVSWVEEEGTGFGEMLLGSRVAAGRVTAADLASRVRSLDDGRPFAEHCREAGRTPDDLAPSRALMAALDGWIEVHIEQGRVLEDAGCPLGVVTAIAGYVHADVVVRGASDHAGATPMDLRHDAGLVTAEVMLALERAARDAGPGTVATVGELALEPGQINVIPGAARFTLDIRSVDDAAVASVERAAEHALREAAARRGAEYELTVRQRRAAVRLDPALCTALHDQAVAGGIAPMELVSGAAHDTQSVAAFAPSAMAFVPCSGGVSHTPDESADPADAARAVEVVARTVAAWRGRTTRESAR